MSRKYLSVIIIAIIFAGSFFIVSNLIKKQSTETPLVLGLDTEAQNNVKNTIEEKKVPEKKLPLPPSIDRPINITASIPDWEREEIIKQIQNTVSSLKNNPKDMHEWIQLGNFRKIIGDYLSAVDYWKYASILEPGYHVPYNNLGNLYQYYLNDAGKAEEYFKKMLEVSPQNEDSYKNLFELYTSSKEKENLALGILEEGVKKVTHNENLKMMLEAYKKEKGLN